MDIKITDSWLRDYLTTKATPQKIGECLSLCGPSVERIEKVGSDYVYVIEVTTNRADSASVYGIAREAAAILPQFKIDAKLKKIKSENTAFTFVKTVPYLRAMVDPGLCSRFTAVLIKNVSIDHSPDWIIKRLEECGVRAINNIVDISNYIMLDLGQPVHTFDYDKIKGAKMILRESKKGEKITTLDGKVFDLPGGDIVIEDGEGRLIDLAGIMGGGLSMVTEDTKNVLLFVQNYNASHIRKTSMALAQRTGAAALFEKGIDSELVAPAILEGIEMFKSLCKGTPEKQILNIYPVPFKSKKVTVGLPEITKTLGIEIEKSEITKTLNSLEFETSWHGDTLEVVPPSHRSKDILASEDVVEEIARIYGYHNLPSLLMTGEIPDYSQSSNFAFETKIKNILSGFGGSEIYTLSLVPKSFTESSSLKLKNPLGTDTEYLRTSLMPSLISAAKDNVGTIDNFHLFEISNVYIPRINDLPEERLMLAGIFYGYSYRNAKGTVEALLQKLNIETAFEAKDRQGFSASHVSSINDGKGEIGFIGLTEGNFDYYEFIISKLADSVQHLKFKKISKYPSQVEDITFSFPDKTKIGEVIGNILSMNRFIDSCSLNNIYENFYTFRIQYHSDQKTLTNEDVEKIRKEIITSVKTKFGGTQKEV